MASSDSTSRGRSALPPMPNRHCGCRPALSTSATLGGTRERPLADGNLEVTQGRLRNIDVQRVGGRVNFDGTLALLDLELVKDQYARLTAKGVVPRTLLEGRSGEHVEATAADRLDVAIISTPIDLALA